MSLNTLWINVKKIWENGRGYELREILEETNESKIAIFTKDQAVAFVYVTTKQVSVQSIKKILKMAEENKSSEVMVATTGKVTPQALEIGKQNNVEFIHKRAPLLYIFDHWLVPEHRVLSKEEAREIIERYAGGNPELLPKILVSDPAVRILRAKPGDIIEIRRKVPPKEELIKKYGKKFGEYAYEVLKMLTPAGEEVTYRIVIETPEEYLY